MENYANSSKFLHNSLTLIFNQYIWCLLANYILPRKTIDFNVM